jgi:hypothetical protein
VYFVQVTVHYRDKKVVGVFVRFSCAASAVNTEPVPLGKNGAGFLEIELAAIYIKEHCGSFFHDVGRCSPRSLGRLNRLVAIMAQRAQCTYGLAVLMMSSPVPRDRERGRSERRRRQPFLASGLPHP